MEPLSLPAKLDSLEKLGSYVVRATAEAKLAAKAAYGLRLAVDEIATNIVTHGHEEAGISGVVTVSVALTDDSLTVVLEDGGLPFDPLSHRLPAEDDLNLPLEERAIGGLGIFLVLKSVDAFRYERAHDVNRNIFVMNRTPNGAA
ncbi:ATP-binding protein [Geomonas sp. Red32]|nr:ATP-binding protein [Geomonas sp. Red32]